MTTATLDAPVKTTVTVSPTAPIEKTFADLGLSPAMLKAVEAMGYTVPSPIQAAAIPALLDGKDVIGQAQTGSGKTAAFALPVIEQLDADKSHVQALIMCPTRELVLQVAEQCELLLAYKARLSVMSVYGGEDIRRQLKQLRSGPQLIVGTPGRLMDLMRRGALDLAEVSMVVLDEADRMLDMGFRDDMETILSDIPAETRQTILFSATMAPEILKMTRRFQSDPVIINVATKNNEDRPKIDQFFSVVQEHQKLEALFRLAVFHRITRGVVFCNTKAKVDEVVEFLRSKTIRAEALHGDLNQNARTRVMNAFRLGYFDLLVATDIAGRGLDVNDLTAVFNYDLPRDNEDYIHRIGRTGRAGKTGKAFTLVGPRQVFVLRKLGQVQNTTVEPHPIPTVAQIEQASLTHMTNELADTLKAPTEKLLPYIAHVKSLLTKKENEVLSPTELAAALLCQMHQLYRMELDPAWDKEFEAQRGYEDQRFDRGGYGGGGGGYRGGGGGKRYGGGGGSGYGQRSGGGSYSKDGGGGSYSKDKKYSSSSAAGGFDKKAGGFSKSARPQAKTWGP